MKYLYITSTLTALLLASTATASPQPIFIPSGQANVVTDIFNGFGDLAKDVVDRIRNASIAGVEVAGNFAQNVHNAKVQLIEEAEGYARAVGAGIQDFFQQSMQNFIAALQAFRVHLSEEIQNQQNRQKRQVLSEIEKQLEAINDGAAHLEEGVQQLRDKWSSNIASEQFNILASWNAWSVRAIEGVAVATDDDEDALTQTEDIINEYVNRYSNYLDSCVDQVEAELQEFEKPAQNAVARYQSRLEALIEQVQACVESGDGYVATQRCQRDARRELSSLRRAPRELGRLCAEARRLAGIGFEGRSCVVQTLAEFELEKRRVQRKIVDVVEQAQAANGISGDHSVADSDESDDSDSSGDSDSSASA